MTGFSELGYVGTHAVHLRETRTIGALLATPDHPVNVTLQDGTVVPITESTFANALARSPNPGINDYSGMQLFANDAYSHYHSLQATVARRWGAGYFQAAYTFSKSTDATSTGNTALNTAFNDQSGLEGSRGLSDFDRTHRFVVSYRYELPFFKDAEGWRRVALSGWAISGITIFQSGTPFSVLDNSAGFAFLGGLQAGVAGAQLVESLGFGAAEMFTSERIGRTRRQLGTKGCRSSLIEAGIRLREERRSGSVLRERRAKRTASGEPHEGGSSARRNSRRRDSYQRQHTLAGNRAPRD